MRNLGTSVIALCMLFAIAGPVPAQPLYNIIDIGVLPGSTVSQGFGVSPNGIATGRSLPSSGSASAFTWTQQGGLVGLPNLAGRAFSVGNGVNDLGTVVGVGSTALSGTNPLPLIWQGGAVSQLGLPAGETIGRAQDINNAGVAVGSVNGGSLQRGAMYAPGGSSVITQTTSNGSFLITAFAINNAGRIVGQGADPNNAARNVGYVLDSGAGTATEVGILPTTNGALAFGVGEAGQVVGASMLNQGPAVPFIWTEAGGTVAIPLPVGTSQGSARGVNANGFVVGTASSAFAIPFLYDGTSTYRLGDLIPAGTGWDLLNNTFSSALGISENGVIVGTGLFNGNIHAYAMAPVPEPGSLSLAALAGLAGAMRWRRRRAQ